MLSISLDLKGPLLGFPPEMPPPYCPNPVNCRFVCHIPAPIILIFLPAMLHICPNFHLPSGIKTIPPPAALAAATALLNASTLSAADVLAPYDVTSKTGLPSSLSSLGSSASATTSVSMKSTPTSSPDAHSTFMTSPGTRTRLRRTCFSSKQKQGAVPPDWLGEPLPLEKY